MDDSRPSLPHRQADTNVQKRVYAETTNPPPLPPKISNQKMQAPDLKFGDVLKKDDPGVRGCSVLYIDEARLCVEARPIKRAYAPDYAQDRQKPRPIMRACASDYAQTVCRMAVGLKTARRLRLRLCVGNSPADIMLQ